MLFYQGHLKVAIVNERRTKHTPVLCRKCSRLPTASSVLKCMHLPVFCFSVCFVFVLVVTLFCSFVFLLLIRRVFS